MKTGDRQIYSKPGGSFITCGRMSSEMGDGEQLRLDSLTGTIPEVLRIKIINHGCS